LIAATAEASSSPELLEPEGCSRPRPESRARHTRVTFRRLVPGLAIVGILVISLSAPIGAQFDTCNQTLQSGGDTDTNMLVVALSAGDDGDQQGNRVRPHGAGVIALNQERSPSRVERRRLLLTLL